MGLEKTEHEYPLIIAVDWDDTMAIGPFDGEQQFDMVMVDKLKAFKEKGASLVLWTCRCGSSLADAVNTAKFIGLHFDSVNDDCAAADKIAAEYGLLTMSIKVYAHLYVDDKAPGSIEHFKSLTPVGTYDEYMAQLRERREQ